MQKIYAHRGASGYAPENTLRAFALAADMGADGVELDVQISKDGRLVVFHDDELSRLTGFTGSVADYTYAELCRMPVIHAVDATERDVAPLLEDVLALLHERGLSVNIELKNSRAAFPALEEKTLEAVEKAGMREKTIYSSFNHYSLLKVRRLDPNAVCGLFTIFPERERFPRYRSEESYNSITPCFDAHQSLFCESIKRPRIVFGISY